MMPHSRNADPFKPFYFTNFSKSSTLPPIEHHVVECLKQIQSEIPSIPDAHTIIPNIVISALLSVNAWPLGRSMNSSSDQSYLVANRNRILEIGFVDWSDSGRRVSIKECWTVDVRTKISRLRQSEVQKLRWHSIYNPVELVPLVDLKLTVPRDGPSEVWSRQSVGAMSRRRIILSYVHDRDSDSQIEWEGNRRPARLTRTEAEQVSRPQFLSTVQCFVLDDLWHDGMKYPTPDGVRNGYAGVVPYMLPGSAVWHCVPRLRKGYGYPSLEDEQLDSILNTFAELRSGKRLLVGVDKVEIQYAEDEPYRDLSGVRRLWLMAEAVCGMLRDDIIISIQDMAGLALTLMHYENLSSELLAVARNYGRSSEIERKRRIPCIGRLRGKPTWKELCNSGEGAEAILKQTLTKSDIDEKEVYLFDRAVAAFDLKLRLLKFWYSLMFAEGPITDLQKLRFEVLEDLAVAPAWEQEDRAMVYFMVEAAVINCLERRIPYEESVRRFLRAKNGGALLLESVNLRSERLVMEMTRFQLETMLIYNYAAALRQPGFVPKNMALKAAWLSGQEGPSYLGRFTTSMSKQLYIKAARSWAGYSNEAIVRAATEGKTRMVVLLTENHRLNRYIDTDSKTEVIVCSIMYMNEEEYNMALSQFGKDHFHAEKRLFKGKPVLTGSQGQAVVWDKTLTTLCAVDRKGRWAQLSSPERLYQIVVTSKIGSEDARLAAIRIACNGTEVEPVAASPVDVINHVTAEDERTLFGMRPDQISPDGVNIVDYSFEYERFWADCDGRTRSTMTDVDANMIEAVVDNVIASLRTKHWR